MDLVFEGKIPARRPKDAHDILGTYKIVSDPQEMRKTPGSYPELENLLQHRHRLLLQERPEANAGVFKEKPNRAGNTFFVPAPDVAGTLEKGLALYQDLPAGLSRAILMMFLISEVHPFTDVNAEHPLFLQQPQLAYRRQLGGGNRALPSGASRLFIGIADPATV